MFAAALFATAAPSHADLFEATLVRVTSGSGMGASDASILTGVDYEYDSNAGVMTQVSASTRIVFSLDPFGNTRLFEHDFTGLSFDTAAGSISATTYACIEGNFGAIVGAALCSNTVFGPNFVNDTTTDYSTIPGTRFVGGDDIVAGPSNSLSSTPANSPAGKTRHSSLKHRPGQPRRASPVSSSSF